MNHRCPVSVDVGGSVVSRTTTLRIFLARARRAPARLPDHPVLYGQWWTAVYMLAYSGVILFGIRVVKLEDSPTTPASSSPSS